MSEIEKFTFFELMLLVRCLELHPLFKDYAYLFVYTQLIEYLFGKHK